MRDAYEVEGPAGTLQVRAHGPTGNEPPVVLCHPHPLHGGTMGSRLVYDLARGLGEADWRAFRFDYRGVGDSAGTYGRGVGEAADLVAVLDWVGRTHREPPVLVGHSFGGAVALSAATQRPVGQVILIGTGAAVQETDLDPVKDAERVDCPVLQIRGSEDELVSAEDVARIHQALKHPTLVEIEGAGHFLEPSRNRDALAAVLRSLQPLRHLAEP